MFTMPRMHNPPHPGEVVREFLGEMSITDAATFLDVDLVTLQRVITGAAVISHEIALRLGDAFGTSPEFWSGMQLQFDKSKHQKN
jgi:addiction module HigA family antidote